MHISLYVLKGKLIVLHICKFVNIYYYMLLFYFIRVTYKFICAYTKRLINVIIYVLQFSINQLQR